jgi:hypothetical protein
MLVRQIIILCWCLLSGHVFRGAREPLDVDSPINIPEAGTFVSDIEPFFQATNFRLRANGLTWWPYRQFRENAFQIKRSEAISS